MSSVDNPLDKFNEQFKSIKLEKSIQDLNNMKPIVKSEAKEIQKLLLILILEFNNFLDTININTSSKDIIQELYDIYIYLMRISKNDSKITLKLINLIPNVIFNKILSKIIDCYNEISSEIISSNSILKYYFAYCVYKCILIIYTYCFYIQFGIIYIKDTCKDSEDSKDTCRSLINTELFLTMLVDKKIIKISDGGFNYKQQLYKLIINTFNNDILDIGENIDKISIDLINFKRNHITTQKDNTEFNISTEPLKKYKQNIYIYLYKNLEILKEDVDIKDNYITIPQYTGICWFVSILTGMCYSDFSKYLINSKIISIKEKTINSEKLFIEIVNKILTVSNSFLKYNEEISENCDLFRFFKNDLTTYLITKLNEVKQIREKNLITSIGDYDNYYITILQQINTLPETIKENHINSMGIHSDGMYILKSLYNILDISSLYIIMFDSKMYTLKGEINDDDPTPDIIIMQMIHKLENTSLIEEIDIMHHIPQKHNTDEGFKYRGALYKKDYILYLSTADINVCTSKNCGHCISSIHYNGKQYYYDSGFAEKTITCDSINDIRIPCSLIRQDWVNQSIDDSIDKEHFSINKCFYKDVNVDNEALKIEYDVITEDNITFYKKNNILCVYVKVPDAAPAAPESSESSGGSKNNYKSTHKKVNIMNKNKNIIERTIHIDNNDNKNKYIKFNKKYEPLSNFKYNKKNKYYYM